MAKAIPTNDIKFVAAILYRVSLEPSYVGVMFAWRAKQVSRLRLNRFTFVRCLRVHG